MDSKKSLVYLHPPFESGWTARVSRGNLIATMDKLPFKNILWKAPFTAGTTSVSNRFWSPSLRSWPTKKLFSIAFASVRPIIIKTFHYYYNHTIEINLFSIYIGNPKSYRCPWIPIKIECGNRTLIKTDLSGHLQMRRIASNW